MSSTPVPVPPEAAPPSSEPQDAAQPPAAHAAAPQIDGSSPLTFRATTGRNLQVLCGLEKILNVERGEQVAARVTPTVIDLDSRRRLPARDRAKLDADDLFQIDQAVLKAARPMLGEKLAWPVIVPVSFHTISRTRARVKLFRSLDLRPELTSHALIAEIVGMDAGTPEGRLNDSISVIRPFCTAVFVEALSASLVKSLVSARISGASLDCRDIRRTGEALAAAVRKFGEAGTGVARSVIVRGLPSEELVEVAMAAGVTHVSVRGEVEVKPQSQDQLAAA